jgi:hypothetical protein
MELAEPIAAEPPLERRAPVTNETVARLFHEKDFAGIREALAALIQSKQRIEAQLAEAKGQMTEVRSEMLRAGEDPRQAQILATATTDHAWRGSAVAALKRIDGRIAKLREALRGYVPEKTSVTGKPVPDRMAVVMRGTAEEIAQNIHGWMGDGWSPVQSLLTPDAAVIIVMRKDFG